MYKLEKVSQTFGVKECDEELIKIYRNHIDPKTVLVILKKKLKEIIDIRKSLFFR